LHHFVLARCSLFATSVCRPQTPSITRVDKKINLKRPNIVRFFKENLPKKFKQIAEVPKIFQEFFE
jgi:hypothetical protein